MNIICVHIIFRVVSIAEWPSFGKELLTRLIICSLCILIIFVVLFISRFGFKIWIWVLIASVPGLCILFTSRLTKWMEVSNSWTTNLYELFHED